ncbi:DinB family protein [Virgibacillus salexigens]|uniref:DinB family protein n=1 Tax=Virgibacillus TaxID=84406 RepID=UPI00136A2836|nr:DinB family protein [Virgibacillus massiliensis]MYL43496.1 DinB family protein [Virgibacillus massiliensis]
MQFSLKGALEVLDNTPQALDCLLSNLSHGWLQCNEGDRTWNSYEVIDHLIESEKHNWIPRLEAILHGDEHAPIPPFDRYAHLNKDTNNPIQQKLMEFKTLRAHNLSRLETIPSLESHLDAIGLHPVFGEVKLSELLSTWVVHDLTHIAQIVRVMAKRYQKDVGSWQAYLGILTNK